MGLSLVLFNACQQGNETRVLESKVESLFPDQKNEELLFSLDAAKEQTLSLATGSGIVIPANCLVDANGQVFKGEYDLAFTEIHSIEDIMRSGIPMEVEQNGEIGLMTTGGMFQIQAKAKSGDELFIRKGMKISVSMADSHKENDYNSYRFVPKNSNEASFLQIPIKTLFSELTEGKWKLDEKLETQTNPKREEAEKKLPSEPEKPVEPKPYKEGKFTFNIKVNLNSYPELKALKGVFWQYAGNDPAKDPENNKWVFKYKKWANVKISGTNKGTSYIMEFIGSDTTFTTEVVPALDEKELASAKKTFNQNLQKFQALQNTYVQKRYEANRIGSFVRTIGITEFGYHNVDAILSAMNQSTRKDIQLSSASSKKIENYYLVTSLNGRKSVLKYSPKNKGTFFYFENLSNMIVAPLPNGKVAYLSANEFAMQINSSEKDVTLNLKEDLYANIVPKLDVSLD